MAETIDCTPSWEAIVPLLVHIIRNGDYESRWNAEDEMKRMARAADEAVRMQKVGA
jgi:hypothetical protein